MRCVPLALSTAVSLLTSPRNARLSGVAASCLSAEADAAKENAPMPTAAHSAPAGAAPAAPPPAAAAPAVLVAAEGFRQPRGRPPRDVHNKKMKWIAARGIWKSEKTGEERAPH